MSNLKQRSSGATVTAGFHPGAGFMCESFVLSRSVGGMLCKRRRVRWITPEAFPALVVKLIQSVVFFYGQAGVVVILPFMLGC